jgi:hypothetical protein
MFEKIAKPKKGSALKAEILTDDTYGLELTDIRINRILNANVSSREARLFSITKNKTLNGGSLWFVIKSNLEESGTVHFGNRSN